MTALFSHLNRSPGPPRASCAGDPGLSWIPCCYGSAVAGDQADCTCWRPVYDLHQAPDLDLGANHQIRSKCCGDCAYRHGSPERADPALAEELTDLTAGQAPFWCHLGIRRVTHWRHPDGRVWPAAPGDYDPPVIEGRPYRADGGPAAQCAGWATLRLAALVDERHEGWVAAAG